MANAMPAMPKKGANLGVRSESAMMSLWTRQESSVRLQGVVES